MAATARSRSHGIRRWLLSAAAAALALVPLAAARADTFLDQANKAAAATPGTKPAHDILMPALAAMTEPPVLTGWTRDDLLTLLLAAPGEPEWTAMEQWAAAEPQQAALKALEQITKGEDKFIIGFGYGRDAVPQEWIDAEIFVDLNDEGLLYSATFPYLKRVGWLVGLALFDSARAASANEGDLAIDRSLQSFRLGRILLERPYLRENLAGASIMLVSLERMRDVIYQFESAFNAGKLKDVADSLASQRIREHRLPVANYLAAQQIIERTYQPRGAVDAVKLAEVMSGARVRSDRTLQRLSEAAFWDARSGDQADWFDVNDKVKGVWADWDKRWKLTDLYDPIFDIPSDFRKMDPNKFLAVYYPLNGVDEVFDVRFKLLLEIAGTVNSMGCVGFRLTNKTIPPQIAAAEPRFVSRLLPDLFSTDPRELVRKYDQFRFWVPIRDQKWDRREDPRPYEVTVAMIDGAGLFVGGGQNSLDRSALAQLAPGIPLPPGMFMQDGFAGADFKIDADRVRTQMLEAADKTEWNSTNLRELTATFKGLAERKIDAENFDEKFDTAFISAFGDTLARMAAIGIDTEAVTSLAKDVSRALIALPSVREAIETADRGEQLRADQAKTIMKESIEAVVQQQFADRVTEIFVTLRAKARAAIEAAGGEGLPTTIFKTMVDDSQFLLYSVGANRTDDRARLVGRAGNDILMWPPILSLQREAR